VSKNLAERYKDIKHFIHVGTSMMYQISENDLTEINNLQGNGVYSMSKLDAQRHINAMPNAATVIPCIIGGPGREGLFNAFVKMIDKFPLVLVPGDGAKPVHMVHVKDVAELIYLIYEKNAFGLFNAASLDPLSINQWIEVIILKLGKKPPYKFHLNINFLRALSALTGYRLLAREQIIMLENRHVLEIEKSIKLGWIPKYSNAQIVEQTADYILENFN
jgi:nucleoside-diphosphate-sugar epimerase